MGELKDCPFCGRGAWVVRVPDTRRFRPQCKKCGAGLGEFDREADAVAAWNRRALSRSEVPAGPLTIYYVAEVLGGGFDNIPISMFGGSALFTTAEAAGRFCDFANGAGRLHEVRQWNALPTPPAQAEVRSED